MNLLETSLLLAGAFHFGILVASANVPKALDWKNSLATLPKLLRQMFWVYGWFIVLCIVAFGTITLLHAETLASGTPLARSFCGFVFVFWLARLVVQFFVFDAKPFLTNAFYRVGYHLLTVIFILLLVPYAWAAFAPKFQLHL